MKITAGKTGFPICPKQVSGRSSGGIFDPRCLLLSSHHSQLAGRRSGFTLLRQCFSGWNYPIFHNKNQTGEPDFSMGQRD